MFLFFNSFKNTKFSKKNKIVNYLFIALNTLLTMTPTYGSNHFIQEICPGVYAGKGITKAGEPFYFGIELIDQSNADNWIRYHEHLVKMMSRGYGVLAVSAAHSNPENPEKNQEKRTGFTDLEYTYFLDKLYKSGFAEDSPKYKLLLAVNSGIAGFILSRTEDYKQNHDAKQHYMAYFSKKPVLGKFPFPHLSEDITLKQFLDVYDDLILSIGVRYTPKEFYYETRGITKNPKIILDDIYRDISRIMFGCIGHAITKISPHMQYMHVKPVPNMHKILCRTFTPEEMCIGRGTCGFPAATFPIDNLKEGKYLNNSEPTTSKTDEIYQNISSILFDYIGHAITQTSPDKHNMYVNPVTAIYKSFYRIFTSEGRYVGKAACGFSATTSLKDNLKEGKYPNNSELTTSKTIDPYHHQRCCDLPHYIKISAVRRLVSLNTPLS